MLEVHQLLGLRGLCVVFGLVYDAHELDEISGDKLEELWILLLGLIEEKL